MNDKTDKLQERIGAQMSEIASLKKRNAELEKTLKEIVHTLAKGRNVGQNRITAALEAEEIAVGALSEGK